MTAEVHVRDSMLSRPVATVHVGRAFMTSESTSHLARYVGQDKWTVDYLPGRQLDGWRALQAMKIAAAPQRPEVLFWAAELGLTAAEAVGMAAMKTAAAAERATGVER
ncbi:hypothetical protein [Nocardia ninae]|uniref:Uncharacterized protein n=1 Tax=Nocardia ninae NBRC 108245 TaxID=1210091 RepID=A0A511MNI2_9NOCA|nr:hypothetical protein [Nocardia ninae]GEM42163.1 hypothetical protein NN4_66820 [Nocardia ninae NBRC 108245]